MSFNIDFDYIKQYKNAKVLQRFSSFYPIASEEVDSIFSAMKEFLSLSVRYYHEKSKRFKLTDHIHVIDVMWHTFILFTEDYIDFCENAFGEIYHHTPAYQKDDSIYLSEFKEQLIFTQKILGDKTVDLWFSNWAKKYTVKVMHEGYDYKGLLSQS